MKNTFLTLIFAVFSQFSFAAETGTVSGNVTDKITGETLPFATIIIDSNTKYGTTTDLDGNFKINIPEGKHNMVISYTGMIKKNISFEIKNGEVKEFNIELAENSTDIDVFVVEAKLKRSGDAALNNFRRESASVVDGVSAEASSKKGDGDAAAAAKRITGVSVEGGKYVFVRGLGDRYTKTTLNGMTIPGLNPDKNTVQMDLFPSNLIDNIVVFKSFTPDLAGDFTGGLVNISTKDIPAERKLVVSGSFGLTTGMNFNKDFILYNKQNTDWVGFAGNDRKVALTSKTFIPDESLNSIYLTQLTNKFSKELGVKKGASSFMNQSYSIGYGNQYKLKNTTYGLNLALNYSNSYTLYSDVYRGTFFKSEDKTVVSSENSKNKKLDKREVSEGSIGQNEVLWSALVGGAMKYKENKFTLSLLHSQNGVGKAAQFVSQNFESTKATLHKHAIEFSQKSVTNLLIAGKHEIKDDKFSIDWKISPTISQILEPDVRSTRLSYDEDNNTYDLQLGDGAGIDRYFRTLNEKNLAERIDLTYKIDLKEEKQTVIKVGASNTTKVRDYEIVLYQFNKTSNFKSFTEDPNTILLDENIWNPTSQSGMYVSGTEDKNNAYKANSNTLAFYAMNEFPITKKLKTIYGLRFENAKINYKGHYNNTPIDSLVHNENAFLPSLNFVYKAKTNMNLRASFSQTVARPSFKEKSNAHIDDPISQTVFIGNIGLKETNIKNLDLRAEYFFKGKEMISISGFYKHFTNPIEMVPFALSPNNIQPKNIKQSEVFGGELEARKILTPTTSRLKIDVGANFTYLISKVNTKEVLVDVNGKTEYDLRVENAIDGEAVSQTRKMQGQSPYIINASMNFSLDSLGINANVSYNVQGEKLAIVGSGIVPDVLENPFHSLNFKGTYTFGKNKNMRLSFTVRNILGDNFNQFYSSFKSDIETYSSYSLGRNFSIGFSYKL